MSGNLFTHLLDTGEFRITESGNIQILNEYMFIVPSPVLVHLYIQLETEVGVERTASLFRDMGRFHVKQAANRYVDQYNFSAMSKDKIVEFTSNAIKVNGFGDIQFSRFDREEHEATVLLNKSVFASRYRDLNGEADHPVDHWLAGLLEEHFSIIFGVDVEVEEVRCEAESDDSCQFNVAAAQ